MAKRLTIFVIVAVILLGVFGLTACDNAGLDDYKATKLAELQAYADTKEEDNYTTENWLLLHQAVTNGKTAINVAKSKAAIDTAFDKTKNAINAVEKGDEVSDFVLKISTEKTVLTQGESFLVEMVFKNNTGEVIEISHSQSWILPFIAKWFEPESPLDVQLSTLKVDAIVKLSFKISCDMPKGQHELNANATFCLRKLGEKNLIPVKQTKIQSNTILLTVI